MWREGQSFDDAFQFVKAARGIANPNMGFACQLLQCQKRVHAIPLSPNSGLRMYRMAPHSPYDALHLVPKLLIDSSPAALDSRGAFILHVVSSIFVWIGRNCDPAMEKDAKAAAFQVVRYERVPGPITTVEEGKEPMEFWDAFSSSGPKNATGNAKEQIEPGKRPGVGRRRVEAYDGDFDLFYQAITGGVVPAFPSSGPGQETHLPARESNWSLLRRKFLSCTVSRFFPDSSLVREIDPHANQVPLVTAELSTSPSHLSPSSLSSESSISSTSSSQSSTSSPSTSSPLLTPSEALSTVSNLTEPFVPPSSSKASVCPEQLNTNKHTLVSHPKELRHSIAERRGSLLPMKLPSLNKDSSLLSRMLIDASSNCSESAQKVYMPTNDDAEQRVLESSDKDHVVGEETLLSCSIGSFGVFQESCNSMKAIVYRWPNLEKLATFSRDDLDPKAVFIFLILVDNKDRIIHRMVYLWIGRSFKHDHQHAKLTFGNNVYEVSQINWNQVGLEFLALMGLPSDLQIKVFEEQDAERFLDNIE
ncbi:hypothetical protein HPP92_006596 [Vanilla planifolia]|uniref:Uncharacterized protein n=1 Tax=Vanilla planifolia TaxID=51239 RepID=A0A835RGL5_VANPL|nr:hypothetical protein HPP92_006596 [Vanilla planifolia]